MMSTPKDFNTSSVVFSSPLTTPTRTTRPSPGYSSTERSTYLLHHSNKASAGSTPHSVTSATSVISAFRELQAKQKSVEDERILALKERDGLRQRLSEMRRNQALWRSRAEIEATESFLTVRTANEQLKYEYGDVEAKISTQESKQIALERHRIALRTMHSALQDDVSKNDAKIHTMEHQNALLRAELQSIEGRISEMNKAAVRSPEMHNKHQASQIKTAASLEQQVDKIRYAQARTSTKTVALQKYMDLIIQINGELSDTLISREQTRAEVMRLSGKIAPPNYTWPKEIPYSNIMDVINEAAHATTNAVIKNTALNASKEAAKTIVRALSPGTSKRRVRKKQSNRNNEDIGHDNDHDEWMYKKRRPQPSSPYTRKLDKYVDSIEETIGEDAVEAGHRDTRYRKEALPDKREPSSMANGLRQAQLDSAAAFNLELLNRPVAARRRSHSASRVSEAAPSFTHRSHSRSRSRSSFDSSEQRNQSMSRSSNASLKSTAATRAIARQGAVTYATRFAAAATAAAAAAKVHNTPSPVRTAGSHHPAESPSLSRSYRSSRSVLDAYGNDDDDDDSDYVPASSRRSMTKSVASANMQRQQRQQSRKPRYCTSTASSSAKASFIPSGNQSSEFNVIASVSKASRAAKELNATIASKAKSLQAGGSGDLFDEIPRVSLMDMQQYLKAVKTLTRSQA